MHTERTEEGLKERELMGKEEGRKEEKVGEMGREGIRDSTVGVLEQ